MNNQLTPRNSLRFSLASCATEDSVDSAGIATPLDASPCPQRNVTLPIINPAEQDSPYLTRFQIPDVAAVVGRHRHRNQDNISSAPRFIRIIQTQDLSPPPSTTQAQIIPKTRADQPCQPKQQKDHNTQMEQTETEQLQVEHQQDVCGKFKWPRIKRILSSSSLSSTSIDPSVDSHRHHTRKKPASSRGGVMTHLSSLVHNSMRLTNATVVMDEQRQQQNINRTTSSTNTSTSLSSPKQNTTRSTPSTQKWFSKSKSRVAPHHCPVP
ncbi:hypothetical protein BC941DRAFT_438630 [Chlamydoabsidia padenii]|nr:hypothetical protein BC941DRAFT_438630 [Chlamydoabsidia padenii]